jgi:hypothetical protein
MRVPEVVKMGKVDSRGFFDDEFIDGQVRGRWDLRQAPASRLPFRDYLSILPAALLGAVFAEKEVLSTAHSIGQGGDGLTALTVLFDRSEHACE